MIVAEADVDLHVNAGPPRAMKADPAEQLLAVSRCPSIFLEIFHFQAHPGSGILAPPGGGVVTRYSDRRGDSPPHAEGRPCSGSICCSESVAVHGMPIQEGGESLRNCFWTLKLQEVSGPFNGAIFHLRQPGTQRHGDFHP